MRCDSRARPEPAFGAHFLEGVLHCCGHEPVSKPGRIADEDVHTVLRARQPGGAREVPDVVTPDVVATLVVQ